jgi:hypothetical protein
MPLFGNAGQFLPLAPQPHPPARVYRVISGRVWWTLLHWPWRLYQAAVATGAAGVVAPTLAPLEVAGVYVTDEDSLHGCDDPAQFAWRLSLPAQTQNECQLFGCAVMRLDLPAAYALLPLPPLPGALPGLTGGGARQWLLAGNIDLAVTMRVDCIQMSIVGPRHYRVRL